MILKYCKIIHRNERDVNEIIKIYLAVISHKIKFLNDWNFCLYYYKTCVVITNWIANNTTTSIPKLFYGFCGSNDDSLLNNAFKTIITLLKK